MFKSFLVPPLPGLVNRERFKPFAGLPIQPSQLASLVGLSLEAGSALRFHIPY